jgi:hypothetical protein
MSKEVKRYEPFGYDGLSALMHEDAEGGWVRVESYEALLLELAEANADFVRIASEREELLAELNKQTKASVDVLAERRRQVEREGWTPAHDDLYDAAELPRAAAAYVLNGANDEAPCIWPFHSKWWKPRDARANYVRAAALLLAEIERIDRAALQGAQP